MSTVPTMAHYNPTLPNVVFFHAYQKLTFPDKRLFIMAKRIFSGEKLSKHKIIHIILCSDYSIKKLNAEFRNKPYPTDVLSFNFDDRDFIGEIYISLQRAAVQARRYGVSYENEIERLFVHGMFHLLGFDHEKPDDRNRMESKELQYLSL